MPTVSVIEPAYDHALLLQKALASALAQDWRDYEIIVVDEVLGAELNGGK